METVCSTCSKGIFSLGNHLADSDTLLQFLNDHKLVPASQKCPKCYSELNINKNYLGVIGKDKYQSMLVRRRV